MYECCIDMHLLPSFLPPSLPSLPPSLPSSPQPKLVYTAHVEMQGTSFNVGVDGHTSITGPGDVLFTIHHTASKESAADTGPVAKFLYSL